MPRLRQSTGTADKRESIESFGIYRLVTPPSENSLSVDLTVKLERPDKKSSAAFR